MNKYHPVQDLHTVNALVITLHPMVPNLYTLLSLLSSFQTWYTVLNFQDAFSCIPRLWDHRNYLLLNGRNLREDVNASSSGQGFPRD